MPDETRPDQETPHSLLRRRLAPSEFPTGDRSRMRMVMDFLTGVMILGALRGLQHIHNHPE